MAEQFVNMCSDAITGACQREKVPWEVTTCGWSEDEEQDRITRCSVCKNRSRCQSFSNKETFLMKFAL